VADIDTALQKLVANRAAIEGRSERPVILRTSGH